jgi:hypothetical protein
MRVQPDPRKLLGTESPIHAAVEEVGDCVISEVDRHGRDVLPDCHKVLDVEEIFLFGNAKAADFRVGGMAKELQFEPGERCERQARSPFIL